MLTVAAFTMITAAFHPAPIQELELGSKHAPPHEVQRQAGAEARFTKLVSLAESRLKQEGGSLSRGEAQIAVLSDPRIQLLSVIFRLAGKDEFGSNQFAPYAEYLDQRFKPFVDHPAVQFARKLRQERQISGDAVANFAIHLSPFPKLEAPASFEGLRTGQWWRPADAAAFAPLVREFARDSKFSEFLARGGPIHELAALRMEKLVQRFVDLGWYTSYFGERPRAKFNVAVSLLQGAINFGISAKGADGREELFAVMGTWQFDRDGLPIYDEIESGSVVIHEFLHSYIDPAVGRHQEEFRPVGATLQDSFAKHWPKMSQFYWRALFEESLIRAAVVRYLGKYKGAKAAKHEAVVQLGQGFLWTEDLAALLGEYETSRSQYATFEQFFPRVIQYFKKLPEALAAMVERFDARRPRILSTTPQSDAAEVDPGTDKIQVVFDRAMAKEGFGTLPPFDPKFEFPEIVKQSFDKAGKVLTLQVRLKANTSYEIRLNSDFATTFRSAEGIPLKGSRLRFRTGDIKR